MESKASKKVPGGKLVRVHVQYDPAQLLKVSITGDFFMHPEDALEAIEEVLTGAKLTETEQELADRIHQVVNTKGVTLVGVTPADIAAVIKEALREPV